MRPLRFISKNRVAREGMGVVLLSTVLLQSATASASDFDYPELSIVPRYSERLESEAKAESARKWGAVVPLMVPFAVNIGVGAALFNPNRAMAHWVPFAVGVGGLIGVGLYGVMGHPYRSAWTEVEPMKNSSLREKLYRERRAEEAIESVSAMGRRLQWFVAGINAATAVVSLLHYATIEGSNSGSEKGYGISISALGIVGALTPLIFRPYWIGVAQEQQDYRKRIFSPVASFGVMTGRGEFLPGATVALQF